MTVIVHQHTHKTVFAGELKIQIYTSQTEGQVSSVCSLSSPPVAWWGSEVHKCWSVIILHAQLTPFSNLLLQTDSVTHTRWHADTKLHTSFCFRFTLCQHTSEPHKTHTHTRASSASMNSTLKANTWYPPHNTFAAQALTHTHFATHTHDSSRYEAGFVATLTHDWLM